MEEDTVIEFLRDITNQLGPAGEEAFRVVAARVFAESLIWVGLGVVVLILGLILSALFFKWWDKEDSEDTTWAIAILVLLVTLTSSAMMIVPNAMNLFSIEYATIERILNLVGNVT